MTEIKDQVVEVVEGQTEFDIPQDEVVTAQTEGDIVMNNNVEVKKSFPVKKVIAGASVATGLAVGAAYLAKNHKQAAEVVEGAEQVSSAVKVSRFMGKALHTTAKHAPLMLTAAGIVGLGVTAYLAYKAKDRVNEIVEDLEERRENDEDINRFEVVRGLTGALALPVVTGIVSVGAIAASYVIMNRRVSSLAGALAVSTAENEYFRRKYIAEHSEEEYNRFMNTEEKVHQEIDEETGEVKSEETEVVRVDTERLRGRWFSSSTEYASDDHGYNLATLQAAKDKLDLIMFRRGYLTLNEVLDTLGFDRERSGFALGWTTTTGFNLDWTTTEFDLQHELVPQLYVSWSKPSYIYDQVETEGRYGIFS